MLSLDERIWKLDTVWASQGRDPEHKYAVQNFLTGAGHTAIKSLIQEVVEECCPAELDKEQYTRAYKNGWAWCREQVRANLERLVK